MEIPRTGSFQILLNESYKCYVALAAIGIPSINQWGIEDNDNGVELFCNQIDSNFNNPKRLMKRILFNRLEKDEHFNSWEAKWFDFQLIDSTDKFLSFELKRLYNQNIKFNKSVKHRSIFLTLAFKPITEKTLRWNAI